MADGFGAGYLAELRTRKSLFNPQRRNFGFVSLRDGIDLNTPAGRRMLLVLAGVSLHEMEVRMGRQLAGIAKAEGKLWGGRKPGTRITLSAEKEGIGCVLSVIHS